MQRISSLFGLPRSPTFQILSDLHLEVGQQYLSFAIPARSPHLLLAGDVGRLKDYDAYLEFLARQTAQFETVFLVLGNHEFYGVTYEGGIELAQQLEQEPRLQRKLVLLHRRAHRVPGSSVSVTVTVLGCTLWSAIPEDARKAVEGAVGDFAKIQRWDVDRHNAAHDADVAWLRGQVEEAAAKNDVLLVATHHAPCVQLTSSPRHVGNPWTPAFATDLLGSAPTAAAGSAACWDAVRVWVFGHTHYSTSFKVNGTTVVSNQRGYVLPGLVRVQRDGDADGERRHRFDVERTIRV